MTLPLSNERIASDPGIFDGKPVVRGTRITVELINDWINSGQTVARILEDYPNLTSEDIDAAIEFSKRERSRTVVRPIASQRVTWFLLDAKLSPRTANFLTRTLGLDAMSSRLRREIRVIITLDRYFIVSTGTVGRVEQGTIILDLANSQRYAAVIHSWIWPCSLPIPRVVMVCVSFCRFNYRFEPRR